MVDPLWMASDLLSHRIDEPRYKKTENALAMHFQKTYEKMHEPTDEDVKKRYVKHFTIHGSGAGPGLLTEETELSILRQVSI